MAPAGSYTGSAGADDAATQVPYLALAGKAAGPWRPAGAVACGDTTIAAAKQQLGLMGRQGQREAARKDIRRAQENWKEMAHGERARVEPQDLKRTRPASGQGAYYHIVVRDHQDFDTFRTQGTGAVQRVEGQRGNGSWVTIKWLIAKDGAHVERGRLLADAAAVARVLERLGPTKHVSGDHFAAERRPDSDGTAAKTGPTEPARPMHG